jgi:hypothetical protein
MDSLDIMDERCAVVCGVAYLPVPAKLIRATNQSLQFVMAVLLFMDDRIRVARAL